MGRKHYFLLLSVSQKSVSVTFVLCLNCSLQATHFEPFNRAGHGTQKVWIEQQKQGPGTRGCNFYK
jgi:hypothetical protein